MSWPVFGVWAVWDSIVVLMNVTIYWLYAERFGPSLRSGVIAGSLAWLFLFVLFWIALFNMNLTSFRVLAVALPLAWLGAGGRLVDRTVVASGATKRRPHHRSLPGGS